MLSSTEVLIVGAGFAGLGVAAYLRGRGRSVRVLERADTIGGTWRDNTYPGCECDIPPALYSYSFAPQSTWSRARARQPEILAHLHELAGAAGLHEHITCGVAATACRWSKQAQRWYVTTDRGTTYEARFLAVAVGALNEPRIPRPEGTFDGPAFHTARWNHDIDLLRRRIAVVGTGASAIQLVPRLADIAAQVTVLQRTAPWILPRTTPRLPLPRPVRRGIEYWRAEARLPAITGAPGRLERHAMRHLHRHIADPSLRAALTPRYRIGCKRILFSDDYFPALNRDTVELVPSPVARLDGNTVVSADGSAHRADVLVYATGFHVSGALSSVPIIGRDGAVLLERWAREGAHAHLGITLSGFPNAFILGGPNTGLAHTSLLTMFESQFRYAAAAMDATDRDGVDALEVDDDAPARFGAEMTARSAGTAWTSGCASWYLDRDGVNRSLWPDFAWRYRLRTRRFDRENYHVPALTAESSPTPFPSVSE
ncbi:MAG: NAD(P)/FAD-dependent oxidoreductase [Rhodococcus sp. (in: high G+C Gram-positive bacteria)]|uniref:flavin-containing monooxygenase n=1 Tax=Rhodococcus sp. TaxID=1831 RepID=UPI003BB751BD